LYLSGTVTHTSKGVYVSCCDYVSFLSRHIPIINPRLLRNPSAVWVRYPDIPLLGKGVVGAT
jgi:hypothetical protein